MDTQFWSGRRVLITGHTGFKGGWLALWLQSLGAKVSGYSLDPPTQPNIFTVARVGDGMRSHMGDIRDLDSLLRLFGECNPEIVFHLAAQPLVRFSYRQPVETYATNVMGTVHVLEAVRHTAGVRVLVNITSDKCYENQEWVWGYRESDALGGYDPYSNSKGCAELATAAYRSSFLSGAAHSGREVGVATARAGNVIGGGDWAQDRLVPDFFRAIERGSRLLVRNPTSTRPWQHVLDPLAGYLLLAQKLWGDITLGEGWNFGPDSDDVCTVAWLAERIAHRWGSGASWVQDGGAHPHEAGYLRLDCSKAKTRLGWTPMWKLSRALDAVIDWQRAYLRGDDMQSVTLEQIALYMRDLDHCLK